MKKFTVYHIPGIKVGCTTNIKARMKSNEKKYTFKEFYILGSFDDIQIASDMEIYYHSKAGYKFSGFSPYTQVYAACKKGRNNGGTMSGRTHSSKTKKLQSDVQLTLNETKETCPNCGFIGAGGSMKRWHFDNCGREDRHAVDAKHPWIDKPVIKCPHCEVTSKNEGAMNRWHFDNCKFNIKESQ